MKVTHFLLLLFTFSGSVFSQPAGPEYKKVGILSNGRISTIFNNTGVIGQPENWGPRFSWGHPNNGYAGNLSIIVSGTLPLPKTTDFTNPVIKSLIESNNDSIFHFTVISDVARPHFEPYWDQEFWSFLPKPGYAKLDQRFPALSTNSDSWPTGWTDFPWYKSSLKNQFNETFFVVSDERKNKFNLSPFNYNPSLQHSDLKGLGLEVKTWYLLASPEGSKTQPHQNVMFTVHEVKNNSDAEIKNFALSWLIGAYIGLTGSDDSPSEYDDDAYGFDQENGIFYTWDFQEEPKRNSDWFGNDFGYLGFKLISSPDNKNWQSVSEIFPSSAISLINDESLFRQLRENIPPVENPVSGQDSDGLATSGEISLKPGETARYVTVAGFGRNKTDMTRNLKNAKLGWDSEFSETGEFVSISKPGQFFNRSGQKLTIQSKLDAVQSYSLQVINKEVTFSLEKTFDLSAKTIVDVDFSILPAGDYLLKLTPVSGDGPYDQISISIQDSWISYPIGSSEVNFNNIEVLANPDLIKLSDHFQFRLKWNGTGKGAFWGTVSADLLDENGLLLKENVPNVQSINGFQTLGSEGYSLRINNLLRIDTPKSLNFKVFPDSLTVRTDRFRHQLSGGNRTRTEGDSLIAFHLIQGAGQSVAWPFGGFKSAITTFKLLDPVTGTSIPFIFGDRNKNGELNEDEYMILLYVDQDVVSVSDSIHWGIDSTHYRFANYVYCTNKNYGNGGTVDSTKVDFLRVPRNPMLISVSGKNFEQKPVTFKVFNPYPNPFNPETQIQFTPVSLTEPVVLKVYTILGQQIYTDTMLPNTSSPLFTWNGRHQNGSVAATGLYLFEVTQGSNRAVKKGILLK